MRVAAAVVFLLCVWLAPVALRAAQAPAWNLDQARPLPAPFSFATGRDALARIFPSYSPTDGTVRTLRTDAGRPAHVGVLEAKPWYANGSRYLVVLVGREAYDGIFGTTLCGGCGESYSIALLRAAGSKLQLVARTPESTTKVPARELELFVKGDGDVALDLAPYRLTPTETLIGIRTYWSVPGAYFTEYVQLFRVTGSRLRMVVEVVVGCCRAPFALPSESVEQGTIEIVPGPRGYNDLLVVTKVFKCPLTESAGFYCPETTPQYGPAEYAIFRFDGNVYRGLGRKHPDDLF
jgi:hypothetical protein